MSTTGRNDPFGSYHFDVTLENGGTYRFKSCSGLKSETKVEEIYEGGRNSSTRKLVGQTTFTNIVLKQGFASPVSDLYTKYQEFLKGKRSRLNLSIKQMGPSGRQAIWIVQQAWICKWEGPDFDASKNEISIESIEIAHEGFEFDGGSGFGGGLPDLGGLMDA
jgi:phage tail-like protein